MSNLSLFLLILCLQSISVQSCDSASLVKQLLQYLKSGQTDAAAGIIAQLSLCDRDALKDAVATAKAQGLNKKALVAANTAKFNRWGDSSVLDDCIAELSETGCSGNGRCPIPDEQNMWGVLKSPSTAAVSDPFGNIAVAVFRGGDIQEVVQSSATTVRGALKDIVVDYLGQPNTVLDETVATGTFQAVSAAVVSGIEQTISTVFAQCSQKIRLTAASVVTSAKQKYGQDAKLSPPPLPPFSGSPKDQVEAIGDAVAQAATEVYVEVATSVLKVVDDSCKI